MEIRNKILSQLCPTDLIQGFESNTNILAQEINCVRIGIVESFNADDITAMVKIASKRVLHYNKDGTQTVRDYSPINAKVCYCNPFETFPLKQGDEVVLLFNDRELETWFINGQANLQNHQRMHDLTDCIAIAGIRSLPKMIKVLTDCLHLFYGEYNGESNFSDIQIKEQSINYNSANHFINAQEKITLSAVNEIDYVANLHAITGNTTVNGNLAASSATIENGATGIFLSQDNKTITVTDGIITGIN